MYVPYAEDNVSRGLFGGGGEGFELTHSSQHVWCNLSDDEIVHPVGRGAQGDTVWTLGNRPDFCDDDPGTGAP